MVFQKGINRHVDRFFWGDQNLLKKDILFFPKYIVRSNHRKVLYEIAVQKCSTCGEKPWKIRFKDAFFQKLGLPIFETNQGVAVLTKAVLRAISYKAESTPKIEFSSCRITFLGNVLAKKLSFIYDELNVVLAIQFSCRSIKLR